LFQDIPSKTMYECCGSMFGNVEQVRSTLRKANVSILCIQDKNRTSNDYHL
jgi:hypothetical protein